MSTNQKSKDSFIGRQLRKRYLIKERIAKGGMGRVYLARDMKEKEHVAIKYIPYGRAAPRKYPLYEAGVLIRLDHPNLPKVRDVFRDDRAHYLVMEYISGDTLTNRVRKKGPLSPERATRYVKDVLDVLNYLHSQQPPIIHRDIKPSNLKFNSNEQLMLVDFGISKEFYPNQKTRHEIRGALTIGYAPPEQLNPSGQTDARSDIFALGGVLYYLLTGKNPPPVEVHPEDQYHVDPRSKNADVPDALAQVVITATRMNKEYRYKQAQDMRYALTQALLFPTKPNQVVGKVLEGIAPELQTINTLPKKGYTMLTMLFIFLLVMAIAIIAYLLLSG